MGQTWLTKWKYEYEIAKTNNGAHVIHYLTMQHVWTDQSFITCQHFSFIKFNDNQYFISHGEAKRYLEPSYKVIEKVQSDLFSLSDKCNTINKVSEDKIRNHK